MKVATLAGVILSASVVSVGQTQQGLTGFKGSLLRKTTVGKTRSAQEKVLIGIKKALEEKR